MQKIPVIIDTREQTPFSFRGYPVSAHRGTLHTGDYSIEGCQNRFLIERKSIGDLASCMTTGRERFEKELIRMLSFDSVCVIVESPVTDILKGEYRSKLNPESFYQSIFAMSIRYRIPFFFGQNRKHAEYIAYNAMRHFFNLTVAPKDKLPLIPFKR